MKKSLITLAVVLFGWSAFAQNTDQLVNNYISVKNALINSDSKGAAQAIQVLQESVRNEADFAQKDELMAATEKLSKAGSSLEKQRAAFNDVSATMWQLVKDTDEADQPLYYQYCPMKKAYWLSKEKEIENPYYGASMLHCGKVVATKK